MTKRRKSHSVSYSQLALIGVPTELDSRHGGYFRAARCSRPGGDPPADLPGDPLIAGCVTDCTRDILPL